MNVDIDKELNYTIIRNKKGVHIAKYEIQTLSSDIESFMISDNMNKCMCGRQMTQAISKYLLDNNNIDINKNNVIYIYDFASELDNRVEKIKTYDKVIIANCADFNGVIEPKELKRMRFYD